MHVHTDKYGKTILHGPVAQAPTLESRVTKALSLYGIAPKGDAQLLTRACELVRAHPSLSATQAVDYVVSKL